MPTYLTPGVYVEEVSSGSKPIEGVGTAVAAFVGLAPGGPINTPLRIANWSEFVRQFSDPTNRDRGPFQEGAYLAHSVYGFFENGGSLCWVVRVGNEADAPAPRAALPAAADKNVEAVRATALDAGGEAIKVDVSEEPPAGDAKEGADPTYKIVVTCGPDSEEHTGLSLKKGRANVATKVNQSSKLIKLEELSASLPDAKLAEGTYTLSTPAVSRGSVDASHYVGDVAKRTGMGGLAPQDEVTIVVMPDIMSLNGDGKALKDLQGKLISHCENAGDRMTILDAPASAVSPQEILEWRNDIAGYDSKMAALYWPWIEIMDPISKKPLMVPPSGHIAGVWCRVDDSRGVHKAPANEIIRGAIGLNFQITHAEQGALNQAGINCIRTFKGRGIRIWGARTLSSDPEWRYINVRRLFNFVSESIMEGTQWSVFEPNDERLWTALQISVSNFLTRVWRDGALFGATPAEAFYVKCDSETNPPEVIEAGQVVCEVGISPVKPAEFVVFRLSQWTGGGGEAEVEEE
jgi:phage tail sheath protein FI